MAARLSNAQRDFVTCQESAIEQVVATYIARHPQVLLRLQRSDLMQEARLAFCKALLSHHDGILQSASIYAICAARNAVRYCAAKGWLEITSDADVAEDVPDPATEEPSLIGRVLSRLKPAQQQVLTLTYGLNGTPAMSYRQAAKRMKCNPMMVMRMKKRAEANLARYRDELIPAPEPQS